MFVVMETFTASELPRAVRHENWGSDEHSRASQKISSWLDRGQSHCRVCEVPGKYAFQVSCLYKQ